MNRKRDQLKRDMEEMYACTGGLRRVSDADVDRVVEDLITRLSKAQTGNLHAEAHILHSRLQGYAKHVRLTMGQAHSLLSSMLRYPRETIIAIFFRKLTKEHQARFIAMNIEGDALYERSQYETKKDLYHEEPCLLLKSEELMPDAKGRCELASRMLRGDRRRK